MSNTISFEQFSSVELRVGTIIDAQDFPEAKKPAYKLKIDLGAEVGVKNSSAQITDLYTPKSLIGRQVICVCNFPPKQIGPFISEVLTTGFYNPYGQVILVGPDQPIANGSRLS
jgi:tRNA-binding protein